MTAFSSQSLVDAMIWALCSPPGLLSSGCICFILQRHFYNHAFYNHASLHGIGQMALKSTIFKAEIQIADMDRAYYADHSFTIARHPSETDERMMMRLLAFVLNADDSLVVAGGLSVEDEPDLWRKDLTAQLWWESVADKLTRQENLAVTEISQEASRAMAKLAQRTMRLQYTIQEAEIWITDGVTSVQVEPVLLRPFRDTRK